MHKRFLGPLLAILTFGLVSAFATSALALPSYGVCSGCHSLSSAVVVHATQTANNGTAAQYSVTVSGPNAGNGWAVYQGSTRITFASGASGSFSVNDGASYTVYGGNANGSTQLYNKVTISPVAPPVTPPAPGGSGGTTPTPAATQTVTPNPVPTTTYRVHFNLHHHYYRGLKAVLVNNVDGSRRVAAVNRKGNAVFQNIAIGSYRLSTKGNRRYHYRARNVNITLPVGENDD